MASYRVTLRRGDIFNLDVTYLADGTPVNLTGFDAELIFKWPGWYSPRARVAAGTFTVTDVTLGGSAGTIAVHIDSDDTGVVPVGPQVEYQLVIFTDATDRETVLAGTVEVLNDLFEVAS
jgi:hypothetical protein